MRRVETDEAAIALADRLNGSERDRPAVVVTTPSGRREPWIDAHEIERQLGDLAEVYLMPTGPSTWSFSDRMPALTQVYGGAGRAYPVGHAWASDLRSSPLRFAYSAEDGLRATEYLIEDAMSMAAIAGLMKGARRTRRSRQEGQVARIVADRALVKLRNGRLGNVSPSFVAPGVAIERVLAEGQAVFGWLDEETSWFDVGEMIVPTQEALASYRAGDVVLAEVGEVLEASTELFLHPLVPVRISREQVTGNERDDLRTLLTRGEVIGARIVSAGPDWGLTLLDVDDDESPVTAAQLLRDGPPWLLEPPEATVEPVLNVLGPETVQPVPPPLAVPAAQTVKPEAASTSRPSPLMLDARRRGSVHAPQPDLPSTAPARSVELERTRSEVQSLQREVADLHQEIQLLRQERATFEARHRHLERQLADQRSRLRKAKRASKAVAAPITFADSEQGFRYAVLTAWARRTPAAEQRSFPLPEFRIGPAFMDSLGRLSGLPASKVADVVFEILTDRAKDLPGRELHPYRVSDAGGSDVVRRQEDGSVLWRASLQSRSASARRIHFWRLPGNEVELVHVGLHDERPPGV